MIEKSIISFNRNGAGLGCAIGGSPIVICSDVYGNEGGDAICGNDSTGNFSQDPQYCHSAGDDYTLCPTSPCLPGNHPTGAPCGLVGAWGTGSCFIGVAEGEAGESLIPLTHFASPNPFSAGTTIRFGIREPGNVTVAVYGLTGRRIRLIENQVYTAGQHQVSWDGRDDAGRPLASGVYFYRLEGREIEQTGRLVLTR